MPRTRRFYHSPGVPLEVRFWERVSKTDTCWVWVATRISSGYGSISTMQDGKQVFHYAHRLSYEWANGPIPAGLIVCHHCDNPPCVRPDHLFLGTHADNLHDAQRKGRIPTRIPAVPKPRHLWATRRGEQARSAKLTESDIRDIREAFATGDISLGRLAEIYHVDISNISRAVHRQSWRHVA